MVRPLFGAPLQRRGGEGLWRQRPLIPQDHHPRHNSDTQLVNVMLWHAMSTSVVTSVSKIRLWQNGVTDDEWWVWPAGANAADREREGWTWQTQTDTGAFGKNGMSVLLMSIVTVASNLTFPLPNIGFLFFFPLFCFSLTSLKEQAMFPRAQLFEAHSFGHPKFSVPTQAVQTLSPLTFPQWQGPGGQTIAALRSTHSWVASGRTTACFVCWFWPPIRETPQSLHGECRTPCQDHYASLQWPWIAAHYSTEDLRDVQFTQGYNARHRYRHWWTELIPDMGSLCCVFGSFSDQQQTKQIPIKRVLHCTAQEIWKQSLNKIPWHS